MIDYAICLSLVALVVTIGVSLTGLLFHYLRKDFARLETKVDGHFTSHLEGKL
jgi:hypothetical protein